MDSSRPEDFDEVLVCREDIWRLLRRQYRKILCFAFAFALLGILFALTRPLTYTFSASFKERSESQTPQFGSGGGLLSQFLGSGLSEATGPISGMQSRELLTKVVRRHALNISVLDSSEGLLTRGLRRVGNNIRAEWALLLGQKKVPVPDRELPFLLEWSDFKGEESLVLSMLFLDESNFVIYDGTTKKELGRWALGEKVSTPNFSFNIQPGVQELRKGRQFSLSLLPEYLAASSFEALLDVRGDLIDKSLVRLSLVFPSRNKGVEVLNYVMEAYQERLAAELQVNREFQLAYLEQRKADTVEELMAFLEERANIAAGDDESALAFGDLEQEANWQNRSRGRLQARLDEVDFALSLLELCSPEQLVYIPQFKTETVLSKLKTEMQSLESRRRALLLDRGEFLVEGESRSILTEAFGDLQLLKEKEQEVEELLAEIDHGAALRGAREVSFAAVVNSGSNQPRWIDSLNDGALEESPELLEGLRSFLEHRKELLHLRQGVVRERIAYCKNEAKEDRGMDLKSADALFLEYSREIDKARVQIQKIRTFLDSPKAVNGNAYGPTLQAWVDDSLVRKLSAEVCDLWLKIQDSENYSQKEIDRLKQRMRVFECLLDSHLEQIVLSSELKVDFLQQRKEGLRSLILDLIGSERAMVDRTAKDFKDTRIQGLLAERKALLGEERELMKRAQKLPARWVDQTALNMKAEMGKKTVETLASLVESKNISSNLNTVSSSPLDHAQAPLWPNPPRVLVFGLLGAVFGVLFSAFSSIFLGFTKGFPASEESLEVLGKDVLGTVNLSGSEDLSELPNTENIAVFRRLLSRLPRERCRVLLALGNGVDYSHFLASLAERQEKRALVIHLPGNQGETKQGGKQGLLGFCHGKLDEIPVQKGSLYDWVLAGGTSPFLPELLGTERFREGLAKVEQNYDVLFFVGQLSAADSSLEILYSQIDHGVISLSGESIEDLKPCFRCEKLLEEEGGSFSYLFF